MSTGDPPFCSVCNSYHYPCVKKNDTHEYLVDENKDKLTQMYEQQREFMYLLQEKRGFPEFPFDLSTKESQKFLRDLAYEAMGELFESNQELKNSKSHRISADGELDRAKYLEELIDSLHYFFEIVIASGISVDELFESYMTKGCVNTKRIKTGY